MINLEGIRSSDNRIISDALKETETIGELVWKKDEIEKQVILFVRIFDKPGLVECAVDPNSSEVTGDKYKPWAYPVKATIDRVYHKKIRKGEVLIKLKKSEGGFVSDNEFENYKTKCREIIEKDSERAATVNSNLVSVKLLNKDYIDYCLKVKKCFYCEVKELCKIFIKRKHKDNMEFMSPIKNELKKDLKERKHFLVERKAKDISKVTPKAWRKK